MGGGKGGGESASAGGKDWAKRHYELPIMRKYCTQVFLPARVYDLTSRSFIFLATGVHSTNQKVFIFSYTMNDSFYFLRVN